MTHPTCFVEHGERYALIDKKVAALVLALWEAGYETIGSCEGDEGTGWVQMPGTEALRWVEVLDGLAWIENDGIPAGRDPANAAPRVCFRLADQRKLISRTRR